MPVDLSRLLQLAIDKKARELSLTEGLPPILRMRGELRPLNLPPLSSDDVVALLRGGAPAPAVQEFREKGSCEFGWPSREAHFFVTGSTVDGKRRVRFRLVPKKLPDAQEHE
jgi:twitching motility protein PilT